jgi:hypothetical protein
MSARSDLVERFLDLIMRLTMSKYTLIEGHATSDLICWAFIPCIKGRTGCFATMQCLHLQGNLICFGRFLSDTVILKREVVRSSETSKGLYSMF